MNNYDDRLLTKEEKINAIKEGIKEAWLEALAKIDIDDAIESGVWSAFRSEVIAKKDLKDIIFDAVRQAHLGGVE